MSPDNRMKNIQEHNGRGKHSQRIMETAALGE